MTLKALSSIDLKGKTVLYRAPYDIDVVRVNGKLSIEDDMRIRSTLPTLRYLLQKDCKIVVLTYVGRPDGKVIEELRTTPHAEKLSELLGVPVKKADDCVGSEILQKIAKMKSGEVFMLENVRFHSEEMIDDDEFAKKLCEGKDIVVFDGFPQAHRVHASTTGILRHLPSVAGLYLEEEVRMLSQLIETPARPFTFIIGGAKISDKVDVIRNILLVADAILVGGAAANVFLKSQGRELGASFVEDVFVDAKKRGKVNWVEDAGEILNEARALGKQIVLPFDLMISDGTSIKIITTEDVSKGWQALDIGAETQKHYAEIIHKSKTVFLAGPMGKFEDERFASGSEAILLAMKDARKINQAETIIAGGDTINLALTHGGLEDYSHLSLAGGATLEFLAGKELPALKPLIL